MAAVSFWLILIIEIFVYHNAQSQFFKDFLMTVCFLIFGFFVGKVFRANLMIRLNNKYLKILYGFNFNTL
jgi:hypothetical protein